MSHHWPWTLNGIAVILKFTSDSRYACPLFSDIGLSNMTVEVSVGEQAKPITVFGTMSAARAEIYLCGVKFACDVTFAMPVGHVIIDHNVTQLNDSSVTSGFNMPRLTIGLSIMSGVIGLIVVVVPVLFCGPNLMTVAVDFINELK